MRHYLQAQVLRKFCANLRPFVNSRSGTMDACGIQNIARGMYNSRVAFSSGSDDQEKHGSGKDNSSWLQRLKGVFSKEEAEQEDVLTMDKFADQLRQARSFGSLTQFGRGLPRGGEKTVSKSLEFQEKIVMAMTEVEKQDLSLFGPNERARVAKQCGCTVNDVSNVITKYNWFKEAARRMSLLKKDGKPLPKSMSEIEDLMGGSWNASASRSLMNPGNEISRNSICPCGSGKKYKRCCAPSA